MADHKFNVTDYLVDLEYLVNIDSGTNYIDGVNKIADFFIDKYTELGWTVKKHDFDSATGPCLEIKNTKKTKNDILLLGHMDTVFPPGTVKERPFKIEGDRAHGPGVIDMKSGLLSIYYAIKSLNTETIPSICVALNSHEETSSTSAYPWIQKLAKDSRFVFVAEPARDNGALVNQRKGLAKYSIEFTGIAAHAGVEPEKGKSAIHELGYWIVELNKLTDFKSETTVNVGMVVGGTAANVVAEKAKATVDVRFRNQDDLVRIENIMTEMTEKPFVEGNQVAVNRLGWRPPMNPSTDTKKLCELAEDIADQIGVEIKWASTGGGSDANFTAAMGTPTLDGLGPIGGGAHSEKEYLEVDSIEPRVNLLRELIMKV